MTEIPEFNCVRWIYYEGTCKDCSKKHRVGGYEITRKRCDNCSGELTLTYQNGDRTITITKEQLKEQKEREKREKHKKRDN